MLMLIVFLAIAAVAGRAVYRDEKLGLAIATGVVVLTALFMVIEKDPFATAQTVAPSTLLPTSTSIQPGLPTTMPVQPALPTPQETATPSGGA